MKLMTEEIKHNLPALYATDGVPLREKKVAVKFFCPWNQWTWYAFEGQKSEEDGDDYDFFGLVVGFETELGYFTLSELESINGPVGLKIERDMHFTGGLPERILKEMGE